MKWKELKHQTRLYVISCCILLVGLGSAASVYIIAEGAAAAAVGYEFIDGKAYPISPESSKRYIHDLELYGGKAAVVADKFNRWFDGLWHGTSLAYTIASLTILISYGFFFVARRTDDNGEDEHRGDNY